MAVIDAISPELVLVDPLLAAVERPREFAVRVIAREIVPLGVPLAPREAPAGRRLPAWLVLAIGLCLLTSGLGLSFAVFSTPSPAPSLPTAAFSSPGDAVPPQAGVMPSLPSRSAGRPTQP